MPIKPSLSSLTKLKNRLDALGEDTHLKAVELFRKVRGERNGDHSLEATLAKHQ